MHVDFTYRPMTLDDVPLLLGWYNDRALHETADYRPWEPYTLDELLTSWHKKLAREHCAYYAVLVDGVLVGRTGLKRQAPYLDTVEYSVLIGEPSLRGQGIGTALTGEMLRVAFTDPRVQTVRLFVRQDNGRAIRCYEKAGYRVMHAFTQNGVPMLLMQVERREWAAGRAQSACAEDSKGRTERTGTGMNMKIAWEGKRKFTAVGASGHPLVMDAKAEIGGEDSGARPMELLLAGLGGCSGIDVVMILEKGRLTVDEFRLDINSVRAEEMPQRFTEIHLHYTLKGPDLTPDKVERAIVLSRDKYCSASASLNADYRMTYELNGEHYEVQR